MPLVSPPPSLPPGPPSSTSSGYTEESISRLLYTATRAEGGRQQLESSIGALSAPLAPDITPETLLELQTMLSACTDEAEGATARLAQEANLGSQGAMAAQNNSGAVGNCTAQQRMMKGTVTVVGSSSTPQGPQGDKRQRQPSDLPVHGFAWPASSHVHDSPGNSGGSAGGIPTSLHTVRSDDVTPRQQALHVARQRIHTAHVDVEVYQVVRTLAVALGASRTETGTIKALHAVLLQLERPEMSHEEARVSTGASFSNFKKWHRRVKHAQLNLPPPV